MMNSEDYLMGWLLYLGGACGLLLCWWWITRKIPWPDFRNLLRLIPAALLLTPYTLDSPL